MKKMVLTGIRKMEMIEVAKPVIKSPTEVLLRIQSVGVCGSDIHYYTQGRVGDQIVEYPFAMGHECSAIVEETGTEVTQVRTGNLVAVDPAVHCFECDQCKSGRFHTCRNLKFLACPGQLEGCLAEYLVMPEACCYKVGSNLSSDLAALVEPLSIGTYAVQLAQDLTGKKIGIIGIGPIGLSVMLTVRVSTPETIYVIDKLDYRLEIAKAHGAGWTGNPISDDIVGQIQTIEPLLLDMVFECCGQQQALDQAVDLLRPGGKLIIIGIPETDRVYFDISKIRRKEITLVNVRRQNECIQPVIDMLENGKISTNFMITHHFDFDESAKAFNTVNEYKDRVIKAIIRITRSRI